MRCENVSSDEFELPCCVEGERGTGMLGEACQMEHDCQSSLCIDGGANGDQGHCSELCETDDDCHENLPQCIEVFGGDAYCFPAGEG